MDSCFISFSSAIEPSIVPDKLNNPFDRVVPEVCKIAALELQDFITSNQDCWKHNFGLDAQKEGAAKGKMFGVLIVKNRNNELGYLCTFSGKLADEIHHPIFVPSVFDVSSNDYFINRGMLALTAIGEKIKTLNDVTAIELLKEERKAMSVKLQKQLFDNYHFLNLRSETKSVCYIFEHTVKKRPPAGAGECATPKLLQYAFQHKMQPLAVAEFWWGKSSKSGDRKHKMFYPACKDKCLPILTYMLGGKMKSDS